MGIVTPEEIDRINILNASILAMHRALDQLTVRPQAVIVDGNRFKPYRTVVDGSAVDIPHTTIVKGDGKYMAIAAASILAKTYRDDYMNRLAEEYRLAQQQGLPHPEAPRGHPPVRHDTLPPHDLQPPRRRPAVAAV